MVVSSNKNLHYLTLSKKVDVGLSRKILFLEKYVIFPNTESEHNKYRAQKKNG